MTLIEHDAEYVRLALLLRDQQQREAKLLQATRVLAGCAWDEVPGEDD